MTRTDIHRPSAVEFDPEAYTCRGVWDMSPEMPDPWAVENRIRIINELIDAGYHSGAGSSRQCGHCGTHIRYAALMVRDDVKEYIFVGETCLDERFEALTAAEFRTLRETARLNRERATKAERIAALIEAHPVLVTVNDEDTLSKCGVFVNDIAAKLRLNGELSPRQIEAFETAVVRDIARWELTQAREAARQAKVAAGVQAPTGRVVITGTVVWADYKEDSYSGEMVRKMIVESPDGWKVWSTIPAAIDGSVQLIPDTNEWGRVGGVEAGMRIEFTATVTPKDGDPTFGFAKRPTKAKILA
jgi:hypothetical protein